MYAILFIHMISLASYFNETILKTFILEGEIQPEFFFR